MSNQLHIPTRQQRPTPPILWVSLNSHFSMFHFPISLHPLQTSIRWETQKMPTLWTFPLISHCSIVSPPLICWENLSPSLIHYSENGSKSQSFHLALDLTPPLLGPPPLYLPHLHDVITDIYNNIFLINTPTPSKREDVRSMSTGESTKLSRSSKAKKKRGHVWTCL